MKHKFIRRTLVDSVNLFKKKKKNRSHDYNLSLKNKSNIILFFSLYILDNLFNRLIIRDLIGISSDKIQGFDTKIVYPPEGPVKNKKFLYEYRRRYFGEKKRLKFIYYFKDYFTLRLNFISNYSVDFGDILLSNKLNLEFNLLNDTLLEKYKFLNRKLTYKQLESINPQHIIGDVNFRKFYKLSNPYKRSINFIKMIVLLQNELNLKFMSYFKMLREIYLSKEKYLSVLNFLKILQNSKLNVNISYLAFIKIIFINYINRVFENYNNNIIKKEIILRILYFYREKEIVC